MYFFRGIALFTNYTLGSTLSLESEVIQNLLIHIFFSTLPGLMISLTCFTRIVIVLSLLKTALGLQQALSSYLIIMLSLFVSLLIMEPVIKESYEIVNHCMNQNIDYKELFEKLTVPIKKFMVQNISENDYRVMIENTSLDIQELNEVPINITILAFMISEINKAFQIGFLISLPFVIIDITVSSILAALGMIMVPPNSIALPAKIIFFVMTNGWSLLITNLIRGYTI